MSKLYKTYMLLKTQNSDKFYLFKCGIFYIFIDNDAEVMSKVLNLKLTNLNSLVKKCGFPINSANKYFNVLKSTNYKIEIINSSTCVSTNLNNYIAEKKYEEIVNDFLKLNIDDLSVSKAYEHLHDFQNKFKKISKL